MLEISGTWCDGKTSAQIPCRALVDDLGGIEVQTQDKHILHRCEAARVRISSRLGNTPRLLDFPAGGRLETSANELVDLLVQRFQIHQRTTLLHRLESHKRYLFIALVAVVGFIVLAVSVGAPTLAKYGARWVPETAVSTISAEALETLDRLFFEPSLLSTGMRQRLADHFAPTIADHDHLRINVLFRHGEKLGPNAFALPDGTIVFTDAMVELADNDDELLAVLAHEIGHVELRHSLRSIIRDSLLAFMAVAIIGDASGTVELFLGLPIVLTELAYSRGFEREADAFSFDYLQSIGKSPLLFAALMSRLERLVACDGASDCEGEPHDEGWGRYFSTHPPTAERVTRARAAR